MTYECEINAEDIEAIEAGSTALIMLDQLAGTGAPVEHRARVMAAAKRLEAIVMWYHEKAKFESDTCDCGLDADECMSDEGCDEYPDGDDE